MSGRGRGRGVSNAPAWMTRRGGGGPNGLPPDQDNFGRDSFGRMHPDHIRNGPPPPGSDRGGPYHPHPRGGGREPRMPPYGGDRHGDRFDDRGGRYDDRDRDRGFDRGRGPPPDQFRRRGSGGRPPRRGPGGGGSEGVNNGGIVFRSYEEEREWVDDRRRKRLARKSKFDVPPTPQQLAADAAAMALSNPGATDFAGIPADRNFAAVPQQTRHARRLYIGHLPPNVTEQELHLFFRTAIIQALVDRPADPNEDPILSVYINHERRFCFLEFKTVEMATACLSLDGIDIHGKGKVKVKRPNDYNPAMAPKIHPSAIPQLDVSRLGIIGATVQDGPNKVFVGGLHYHLTEDQVLELLQAFGKVKAFHLVKNEPDSLTSKGYCFVEYADPSVTQVAVLGLNGMDLGGGKILTARVAGERSGAVANTISPTAGSSAMVGMAAATQQLHQQQAPAPASAPRPDAIIIGGYDVEALVDAAMGLRPMPTAPMHVDQFGVPITRHTGNLIPMATAAALSVPLPSPVSQQDSGINVNGAGALPHGPSALDIANAALDAAFGAGTASAASSAMLPPPPPTPNPTRILVLHNMVADEDLATDEEFFGLKEEVQEECAKFGKLLSMKIPRGPTNTIQPSAVKKIFLEYATQQDAANAERELAGRQFGPSVVQASYFHESDYMADKLA